MTERQLETEQGRKYLIDIPRLFERGIDVPATLAARFSVKIGSGRFDRMAGRMLMAAHDDLDLDAAAVEQIIRGFQDPAGQRNATGATVGALDQAISAERGERFGTRRFEGVDVHDAFAPGRYPHAAGRESRARSVGLSKLSRAPPSPRSRRQAPNFAGPPSREVHKLQPFQRRDRVSATRPIRL
jgi:hypothetical protein